MYLVKSKTFMIAFIYTNAQVETFYLRRSRVTTKKRHKLCSKVVPMPAWKHLCTWRQKKFTSKNSFIMLLNVYSEKKWKYHNGHWYINLQFYGKFLTFSWYFFNVYCQCSEVECSLVLIVYWFQVNFMFSVSRVGLRS